MKHSTVYKFSLVPLIGGEQRVHLGSGDEGVGSAFGAGFASGAFPGATPGVLFRFFHKNNYICATLQSEERCQLPSSWSSECDFECHSDFPNLESYSETHFQRFWRVIFYFLSGVSKFSVAVIPDGITNIANNLELHNYKSRLFAEKS